MTTVNRSRTYFSVLVILSSTHLLNDLMQSLIPASYPVLKETYSLDFVQIGMITLTFQIAGALLQPVIGMVADRHAAPYSPVVGMMFTVSWSCPAYVPVSQLIYAALRSKAKGLFPPSDECRRLGL